MQKYFCIQATPFAVVDLLLRLAQEHVITSKTKSDNFLSLFLQRTSTAQWGEVGKCIVTACIVAKQVVNSLHVG